MTTPPLITTPPPEGLVPLVDRLLARFGRVAGKAEIDEAWYGAAADDTLERLLHVAGSFGLVAEARRGALRELGRDDLPLLVAGGEVGAVVLVATAGPEAVELLPLTPGAPERMSPKTFESWARRGRAFHLHRIDDARTAGETAEAAHDNAVARLRALNPLRNLGVGRLGWVLIAAFLSNLLGLATSLFIMVVYDRVLPNKATESLYALAIGVALALLFDMVLRSAREGLVESATRQADARVTEDIFDQYVATSNLTSRKSVGELAVILRDFETYRDFMSTAMILTFVDLPFVLIFIAVIWSIAGLVFLVPLLALPIVILLVLSVQPLVARSAKAAARSAQTRQGLLVEVLSGLDALRVTGAYAMMKNRFLSQAGQHTYSTQRSRKYNTLVSTIVQLTQQVSQVAVIVVGFHLFVAQEITMGAIIAAVILTGRVMGPVARLGQTLARGNMALVAYRNLKAFLGTERRSQGGGAVALQGPGAAPPAIEISNVTLRLAEGGAALFNQLNLTIRRGERVAIVGRTGSGKSTLLRLMNGLSRPEAGVVLSGGVPVAAIPRAELHRRIGTVFQQPWIVSGTLFDNVAFGHADLDEAAARAALEMAGLAGGEGSFALSMPIADQGANLSGGERQAVALARAFAFDPLIYLLDEPSSAMDQMFENRLIEQVQGRLKGQTFVIVTHKARMLDLCERVIVLERGRVIDDMPMSEYRLKTGQRAGAATGRRVGPLRRQVRAVIPAPGSGEES